MNEQASNSSAAKSHPLDIAVVGMGCWFPGARDPRELWENVLACRRQFRQLPPQRLGQEYYSSNRKTPDATYCRQAAVIDGFEFNSERFRIPSSTQISTDIAHWLALHVAGEAINDARLTVDSSAAETQAKTGVVVGNTLTGEQTRSNSLRLRWPFVRRALELASHAQGLSDAETHALAEATQEIFKSVFATVNEDTLAGGLSNTIAGRICNHFDFHGGGYTVDGACASSLLAVCTAADALTQGRLDVALAGGVDISLDAFELVGFAKIGALASEEMRVYDVRGDGFLPGEGCGFVVMKRAADARAAGDHIYAIVRGCGISSDGRGAITAPTVKGQRQALDRAYQQAGYLIDSLDFIEGHGTGTAVGDRVEIEAIAALARSVETANYRRIGLTSIKSIIGHAKAAAGIAGFLKSVIAVNRRVLPPLSGCQLPHACFEKSTQAIYPLRQGCVLPRSRRLRAGVSAMGFGGINTHVTLESADPPSERLAPRQDERELLAGQNTVEAFVFAAHSWDALTTRIERLMRTVESLSEAELADLAFRLASELPLAADYRAVALARRPSELTEVLRELAEAIERSPAAPGAVVEDRDARWSFGQPNSSCRIGFVFPGQGSQQLQMGRGLVERHAWAQEILATAVDAWAGDEDLALLPELQFRDPDRALDHEQRLRWERQLAQTRFAQPAICLASVLDGRWLARLGVRPDVVCGHSLGELVALHFAGAYDQSALWRLAATRGRIMDCEDGSTGRMLGLQCSLQQAKQLVDGIEDLVVANRNGPRQIVASGDSIAVNRLQARARECGVSARELPVRQAFHSPLMKQKAKQFYLETADLPEMRACELPWVSSVADFEPSDSLNLRDHLRRQITAPVDFVAAVECLAKHCDIVLEVGPGRVLTDLVRDNSSDAFPAFCVSSTPQNAADLAAALAGCFIRGTAVDWTRLYDGRLIRPFVPAKDRSFLSNACESLAALPREDLQPEDIAAFSDSELAARRAAEGIEIPAGEPMSVTAIATDQPEPTQHPLDFLMALAMERTGFSAKRIATSSRLLDDLNLDSIKAAELVSSATLRFGVADMIDPANFANCTLQEVAEEIDRHRSALPDHRPKDTADASSASLSDVARRYPTWVRNFVIDFD